MVGKAVVTAALAALLAAPAAASQRTLLMPGVTFEREVDFTSHGPVVVHVLRGPRPTGLYALKPVLSNDAVIGRERVTQMQRRVSTSATVAGVNGDLFNGTVGYPSGMLMLNGVLASPPNHDRSSTGIAPDGTLRVERVKLAGTWQGTGQRRPLVLNKEPAPGGVSLYTPTWGPATPAATETVELVLQPFPAAQPLRDLAGVVVQAKQGGATPIPAGGAVLVGRGALGAGKLAAEAPLGANVVVRLILTPDWSGMLDAIGGGPVLIQAGRPVFRADEGFTSEQLVPRQPRCAVGQTQDGRIILATIDGRRPGYSVGMTNFELALLMMRFGAYTASALDGGGSATMAFDGKLLNRPSDPSGERPIAESLNLFYYGVYAPALPEDVVSPNNDGVGERQTLAYKIVRPSSVRARLIGPDGSEQVLDEGSKATVGTYRFSWAGPGAEGTWRFVVDATDDLGRASSADRTFSLNTTLAALRVETPTATRNAPLRASFTLSRPAQVRSAILSANGAVVRTLAARNLPAGGQSVTWNGRNAYGSLVHTGRYQVRVTAQSDVGSVSQTAPFAFRRR
ncbi:MAG TPA: phosphodiester glycosidase family protein [Gaiellaceae bacterium]|nr:phosphodiester glycosidase family protein [Gaiellaceae bacterium]